MREHMLILPTSPQAYKNPTRTHTPSPNTNLSFPVLLIGTLSSCPPPYSTMATSRLLSTKASYPCKLKPPPKGPPANPFCPHDMLRLGSCADLLGLVNVVAGDPPSGNKCCSLLAGLVDLEAAACLCTAIKAKVLGINLNVPVLLSALVSACKKTIPPGSKSV